MTNRTAVILVVGLNQSLLKHAPRLSAYAAKCQVRRLVPPLPAVTCTAQSSMVTGRPPSAHGVVANGWFNRDQAEVQFWKQSNRLVQGDKVWHAARKIDPAFTCATLFWWYNMYAEVDWSVTPRPIYKADGRKLPDVHTHPADLRDRLQKELGTFPLFKFWGPAASIESTRWIADAALRVEEWHRPTLSLVYLPHLDYPLQKLGPDHPGIPAQVLAVDIEAGRLLDAYQRQGVTSIIVSEYGIEPVSTPVHVNRALRQAGLCRVREEEGLEVMDAGASEAFAVADHQVAHIYIRDQKMIQRVAEICRAIPGVAIVLDKAAQREQGLGHDRSGELVLVASPGHWFTYYYWLDDQKAPDFARTVDIHRKPGYDPVELFLRPGISKAGLAWRLMKKKMGFRTLFDVIPLDAALVRGSHGRVDLPHELSPLVIAPGLSGAASAAMPSEAVHDVILSTMFQART
ncbi:MAG: alkaline phosphatase family protein [Pyrinomonadaceae bacterium]|nr:alkaline phosphatase family protein [Phycisphaerales bacterium]